MLFKMILKLAIGRNKLFVTRKPQKSVDHIGHFTMSCIASITVDFCTINTGAVVVEYEFLWAKRYSPKARTFCGGKQSLKYEFPLSSLGP